MVVLVVDFPCHQYNSINKTQKKKFTVGELLKITINVSNKILLYKNFASPEGLREIIGAFA